jgi:hypothetical protein
MRRGAFALLLAGTLVGCASLDAPFATHLRAEGEEVRSCAEWFARLDADVAEAGIRDASGAGIAGFPYLRANRLLASFRAAAGASEQATQALADRLLNLDVEARRFELMNLPQGRIPALLDAVERTQHCGKLLREIDMASPASRQLMLERLHVPDDYGTGARVLGLYALTKFPFAAGVRRYEAERREAFARDPGATQGITVIRYAPPLSPPLPRLRATAILARGAANPLGVPEPGASDLKDLLAAHAPVFEIGVAADYDRFGALRWGREGLAPEVDGGVLAVYAHAAWTRYEGRTLLQLVYTLWFPERPTEAGGSLLAGKLDGVVWRVTLAPDGEPLVYDSIHPCGCYHLFFPTPRALPRAAPDNTDEWMFSPQAMPRLAADERPVVRIESGTHYIDRVGVTRGASGLVRYELRSYDELRSLPRPAGGRASVFGPEGLVAGTERAERFLFWPMGIASAGSMRQWGRQPTAFVGRRHFDEPDLIEKRFRLELP